MKDDFSKTSKKILLMVFLTLAIAAITFSITYKIEKDVLDYYFKTSSFINKKEAPYVEKLQKYINDNNIKISECERLEKWAEKEDISYLSISKEREIIYGITFVNEFELAGNASDTIHDIWIYLMPIEFEDEDAEVFIYADYTEKYYTLLSMVAAAVSIVVSVLLIYFLINKQMKKLKGKIQALSEAEKNERESKDELVRSMSHDLRTPLTGLIAYAEIAKINILKGMEDATYIDKVIDKANEIRELTDQIFDFTIISADKKRVELEKPELFRNIFEDYLSDFCGTLEAKGYKINVEDLDWIDCKIAVNTSYVGRIFNNLISNIYKYGQRNTEVYISTYEENICACIHIKNKIDISKKKLDSTGIGLKNIENMMIEMGGRFEILNSSEEYFESTLYFMKSL